MSPKNTMFIIVLFFTSCSLLRAQRLDSYGVQVGVYLPSGSRGVHAASSFQRFQIRDVSYTSYISVMPGFKACFRLNNATRLNIGLNFTRIHYKLEHRNLDPCLYALPVINTHFRSWSFQPSVVLEERILKNEQLGLAIGFNIDYQTIPEIQTIKEDEINILVLRQVSPGIMAELTFYPARFNKKYALGYTYVKMLGPQFWYGIKRELEHPVVYQFAHYYSYHCFWLRYSIVK